ncbi:FkbM family methyltransferase [Erythrobacter colymbi]|uniref:FkbM family methyltransferase n=1 Tax=Erythrobacter colymbi TaxID=1161202 RepID=UPI000A3C6243|nr:FkbM family methyltransferase [Erythrobacter colymbi]
MINARSIGKRVIPNGPLRRQAKILWDEAKVFRDRRAFGRANKGVSYVDLSKDQIKQIQSQGYFGQICQDYFLDFLFPYEKGVFLDIGANKPDSISNTLFFEKKGWTGYAFDPIRSFKELWKSRPNTVFINAGVSKSYGVQAFVEIQPKEGWEHALSGFKEYVRAEDMRDYDYVEYEIECGPVSHFIDANVRFDFVSIDVEGAEDLILSSIDFDTNPPRAIVLENNHEIGGTQRYRDLLASKGYRILLRINASDDIFVHSSHEVPEKFNEVLSQYS